jgi:hypothetical protein
MYFLAAFFILQKEHKLKNLYVRLHLWHEILVIFLPTLDKDRAGKCAFLISRENAN